jgi:DNA-binding HxlR family transcriptional regulator
MLLPMSEKSNRSQTEVLPRVQRAVVLEILRDGHEKRCSRSQIDRSLSDIPSEVRERALLELERDGLLERLGEMVCASPSIRRLDELDLIAV